VIYEENILQIIQNFSLVENKQLQKQLEII